MFRRTTAVVRACLAIGFAVSVGDVTLAQSADQGEVPRSQEIGELPGDWTRRGDTGTSALPGGKFAFGVQYRLVYDGSDLPGPAGSTAENSTSYDFFRQRVRVNLELAPNESVGAFVQAEFRGGWGGTAPSASDPRDVSPTLNPLNRIPHRGLRYTYLYWKPSSTQQLMAGIVPVSDEFGDTLFSADWDWNAGGAAFLGGSDRSRWRLAALNMIEGVGSTELDVVGNDGILVLADYTRRGQPGENGFTVDWGGHVYGLFVQEGLPLGGTRDVWVGPTVTLRKSDFTVNLFGIVNTGDLGTGLLNEDGTVAQGFGDGDARSHTGMAFRVEAAKAVGRVRFKAQFVRTSGDSADEVDNRFATPMGLFGTSGYWGYTHIFTANGPSDVNDLGLDIGNHGAGLVTAQLAAGLRVRKGLDVDVAGAWFHAGEPRNAGRDMGFEVSGQVKVHLSGPLYLDAGGAVARLGRFFGEARHTAYEIFSRLQLQY